MNLVKKIAIGAATIVLSASAFMTPVFADAEATNESVDNNSDAHATANDNDITAVIVVNNRTRVRSRTWAYANSGWNFQSNGGSRNTMTVRGSSASGNSSNNVNQTIVSF